MAPPTQLAIAYGSVTRLVKEEVSYHKELVQQEARLKKLEDSKDEDENAEFQLKQDRAAIDETKAVFEPLRIRIADALQKLEDKLEAEEENASELDVTKAKEAITQAKATLEKKE